MKKFSTVKIHKNINFIKEWMDPSIQVLLEKINKKFNIT